MFHSLCEHKSTNSFLSQKLDLRLTLALSLLNLAKNSMSSSTDSVTIDSGPW